MTDGPSPTGSATYELFARIDRRILGSAECVDGTPITPPDPPAGECHGVLTQLSSQECEALYDLNALGLAEETGTDPCTWQGVNCTDGHVEDLDIRFRFISGPIPASLGGLSDIRSLALFSTLLTGPIPAELGSLTNLEYLELRSSLINGSIPAELGNLTNLQTLDLGNNRLSGPIPAELGNLTNLEVLGISGSDLSGPLPPEFASMDNLWARRFTSVATTVNGQAQFDGRAPGCCMLICMQSTSVRIDSATHEDLKRLAAELNTTVGNAVTLAVRALRQDRIGSDLGADLRDDEGAWLDAELG